MSHVTGPSTHVARPSVPRVAPPAPRPPAVPDSSPTSYEQLRRRAEQEQADAVALRRTDSAPSGVEPVSTQAVLHLRQTAAPVGHIADAYGLSPSAVRRMLRSTGPARSEGPSA